MCYRLKEFVHWSRKQEYTVCINRINWWRCNTLVWNYLHRTSMLLLTWKSHSYGESLFKLYICWRGGPLTTRWSIRIFRVIHRSKQKKNVIQYHKNAPHLSILFFVVYSFRSQSRRWIEYGKTGCNWTNHGANKLVRSHRLCSKVK